MTHLVCWIVGAWFILLVFIITVLRLLAWAATPEESDDQ